MTGFDLPQIYAFIAAADPAAGERVLDAVDAVLTMLAEQPEIGLSYPTKNRLLQGVRMLPVAGFPNYLVFYRITEDAVRVLYIVHGAQHLPRLLRQEPRL